MSPLDDNNSSLDIQLGDDIELSPSLSSNSELESKSQGGGTLSSIESNSSISPDTEINTDFTGLTLKGAKNIFMKKKKKYQPELFLKKKKW